MAAPAKRKTNQTSNLARTFTAKPWLFPLAGLAVGTLCSCMLIAGMVLVSGGGPRLGDLGRQLGLAPARPTPTPQCVEPALTLSGFRFRIDSLARQPDGSLAVPENTPGVAYWVEGTGPNYVFALSPLPQYSALPAVIKVGDPAQVQWADCGQEEYMVQGIESNPAGPDQGYDPSRGGIRVLIMSSPTQVAAAIQSGSPQAVPLETQPTEPQGTQAGIDFLETTVSEDGKTLTTGITIHNTGNEPIPLTPSDFSLTVEGGQPQAPIQVEPPLPAEIAPGQEDTFYLTFPAPPSSPAVFRILDFTVDLYF